VAFSISCNVALGDPHSRPFNTEETWVRRTHHRRLGEVNVVWETDLASTFQQPKQRSPFVCSSSTADNNDDAMMWLRCPEMEKVVSVASQ
jgi:hypothetical protein